MINGGCVSYYETALGWVEKNTFLKVNKISLVYTLHNYLSSKVIIWSSIVYFFFFFLCREGGVSCVCDWIYNAFYRRMSKNAALRFIPPTVNINQAFACFLLRPLHCKDSEIYERLRDGFTYTFLIYQLPFLFKVPKSYFQVKYTD